MALLLEFIDLRCYGMEIVFSIVYMHTK